MDSDDEYGNNTGRTGPLRILNIDDDETENTNGTRRNSRQGGRSRGPRGRHPRNPESSQSRSESRGGNAERGHRGDGRGRGSRGGRGGSRGASGGLTRGASGGLTRGAADLRRYSSLSRLDTVPNRNEDVQDATNARYRDSSRPRRNDTRSRPPRMFGYRKLSELSEKTNSDDVLMELLLESSGFQTLLKNINMQIDWSRLLLSVLGKACSSSKSHSKLQLVGLMVQENVMMLQVTTFLAKIKSRIAVMSPDHLQCMIQDVCKIMKELMQRMPQEVHTVSSAVLMLDAIAEDHTFNLQQNPDILELINDVSTIMKTLVKDIDNQRRDKNIQPGGRRNYRDMESLPPPNNFRELPILPDLKDLQFNERPFIRRNKIDGSYDDLHHYLDVQFRLLREDYIQPLRNGITEYRRGKKDAKQRFQDIRLYNKVKVIRPVCSNSGILHVIQFDVSKMQKMRWESSRRLIHGSLVCLSQNDFETILFATVTNRDVKLLQQGLIEVQFKNNFQSVFDIKPSEEFIMAETTAYFEAYRHILRGLQEIEDGLPMQQYIVECKQVLKPPKYIRNNIHYYDFSPLLPKQHSSTEYVPVINTRQWPSAAELQMDKSQYRALQMAVTKEMALIQGPPGTGKTFVGLKVMQLLLHNSDVWRRSDDTDDEDTPNDSILVVCYTNHALDQFLEGVSEFCDSIVRIGGRCSNPILEPFMLSNLRKEARMNRQIPKLIWERKADCRKQMNVLKDKIEDVSAKLDASRLGIMQEKTLELFIKEQHYTELISGRLRNKEFSAIQFWLSSDLQNVIPQTKEDTSTRTSAAEYSLYSNWIDKVINGPSFELGSENILQGDLWTKKLVERLCIYKQWVNSYISYKQKCIDDVTEDVQALVEGNKKSDKTDLQHKQMQLQRLQKDVQTAETQIMSENALKDGLRLELRQHLDSLLKTKSYTPTNCSVMEHWLHINDNTDSQGLFAEALEALASVSETIDTLEEAEAAELERIVYVDEEEDIKQPKLHEEMLSRAMADLAYTFTGTDNMTEAVGTDTQWQVATSTKNTKAVMRRMLEQSQAMSEKEESRQPADVWTLSVGARFSLYKLWLSRYQDSLSSSIQDIVQQYSDICDVYQEVMDCEDVDVISGARVIAMTTTGAAKYRNILRSVNPKIIVVEEAAEVLESHIVSTINSNCQHLILIGDHKQLRPTPTVYQLAVHYNLEISLFERMIKNEINFVTLELQHRMRPEISKHMRHIYPELRDHPSVFGMKDVLGVERNIYFIDHSFHETFLGETKSRSNSHEAEYIVCLCKYLLQQGYKPTQITVLTMYTGQVFALKKLMPKKDFEGVRVTAVDNYQGEENDIILLSLVRSNNDGSVGFLKTDNRVCVGLSRAKMGFYVIGNFSLLCSKSNLWSNIVQTLKDNNAFGSYLTLKCQNHPEKTVKATMKSDFSKTPNGGCTTPCETRLPCGHVCEQYCHIFDSAHQKYRCLKPCAKEVCDKGHVCTKKCWQECGKCVMNIIKTIPVCGHKQLGPCHQDPHSFKCRSKCEVKLSCGHICSGNCGKCKEYNTHQIQCPELIQRKLICGHLIQCKCYQRIEDFSCTEKCTTKLDCGHPCSGTCGGCFQGRLHLPCFEKCTQMLICGHRCGQKCGEPCPPCVKKCGLRCEHSACSVICGKPCLPCTEPCTWACEHQKCTRLCHEMCDRIPCDMPCPQKLECGHSCSGLCGEVCPKICYYCDEAKAKEIFKDATPATRFIVLVDCTHTVEKVTMDTWMNSDTPNSKPFSPLEIKQCPTCNKPILNSKRYGNIIKQSRGLINAVKQQLIGSKRKIHTHCQQMKVLVAKLQQVDTEGFNVLMRKLEPISQVTMASLEVVDIQRNLLQSIIDKLQELQRLQVTQYQRMGMQAQASLRALKGWVIKTKFKPNKTDIKSKPRETFTPQEQVEVREEMLRLSYVTEVIRCADHSHLSGIPSLTTQYDDLHRILEDGRPMTQSLDEKLIKIFKSLNAKDPSCQPIAEQRCIPKSMNDFAQRGRWQKCNEANHLLSAEQAIGTACPQCLKVKLAKNSNTQQKPPQTPTRNTLHVAEKVVGHRIADEDLASTFNTRSVPHLTGNNWTVENLAELTMKYKSDTSSNASVETEVADGYVKYTEEVTPIPKPRRKKIEVPNAYDVMDWKAFPPKPRKMDQDHETTDLQLTDMSSKQIHVSGYTGQTQVSQNTDRKMNTSERTNSGSPVRISYDRESLKRLRTSPYSHVFPPCLHRADLLSILNIPNDRATEVTTEVIESEEVTEANRESIRSMAPSTREDVISRAQNNSYGLQWTDPKPVVPVGQTYVTHGDAGLRKTSFTSQTDRKLEAITSEEAVEINKEAVRKMSVPSRKEVIGGDHYDPTGYQWTDPKPVMRAANTSSQQADVGMKPACFTLTTDVKRETTRSEESMEIETRSVRDMISRFQSKPAGNQLTDPKPVEHAAKPTSPPADWRKAYFTPQTDVKTEITSSYEEYRRPDVKPVRPKYSQSAPEVETELKKTYDRIQIESETDSVPANPPIIGQKQRTKMLFQCIENNCTQLEAPGLSGRCQEHYAMREVSLLERLKKFWKN
ncbi:NFX1-type zinc finger-containing protein 1-like isoform X2 [Mizuhopecten yessoensis]|uniref:NFX1-type zinc finger-containing protein 1 n=1 Tax=Mizuhopecten yessoensis TaxID=6573 RepID=A0A210PMT9_MIZYE|nr:NFX1-type zinc finger-containing protein 1-like isoform X2 [Mizuhopecten yessoensis]OWF37809.1 NFX1-type zinc finger-containing protein 1 [Mizuhopecten yessoensis]